MMKAIVFSKELPSAEVRGKFSQALKASGMNVAYFSQVPTDILVSSPQALISLDAIGFELMMKARQSCPSAACGALIEHKAAELAALIDGAYSFLLTHKLSAIGAYSQNTYVALTGEKGIAPCSSYPVFVDNFVRILASRSGKRHFKTALETVAAFDMEGKAIDAMLEATRNWARLGCFNAYEKKPDTKYPGAEFGFVAHRVAQGTLVTARASNKSATTLSDLTLIRSISGDNLIDAQSISGKKPSLNGYIAHRIFALRPEIQWVLHMHAFMPAGKAAPIISAPGTVEDWLSIERLVTRGERLINQPLHGSFILLEKPEELLTVLRAQNLYHFQSEQYELAYARFLESSADKPFERAIRGLGLPSGSKVLDLCCGTGASTRGLLKMFTEVDIADGSSSMLAVAEKSLKKRGMLCHLPDLKDLEERKYDLISLRQAFNYVSPAERSVFFSAVRRHLKRSGWFVFNTFVPRPEGIMTPRRSRLDGSTLLVRTEEYNQVIGDKLKHAQRTEIIDTRRGAWNAILDYNEFYQHDPDRIMQMLKACGFSVSMIQTGNSLTFTAKTDALS